MDPVKIMRKEGTGNNRPPSNGTHKTTPITSAMNFNAEQSTSVAFNEETELERETGNFSVGRDFQAITGSCIKSSMPFLRKRRRNKLTEKVCNPALL
jgi:hypothetical protein